MLETSRIESGGIALTKTRFDICEMTSQIALSFEQALTGKAVDVSLELPDRLIVVGANAIGIENGQLFTHLGSQVTFVEALDRQQAQDHNGQP